MKIKLISFLFILVIENSGFILICLTIMQIADMQHRMMKELELLKVKEPTGESKPQPHPLLGGHLTSTTLSLCHFLFWFFQNLKRKNFNLFACVW